MYGYVCISVCEYEYADERPTLLYNPSDLPRQIELKLKPRQTDGPRLIAGLSTDLA